MTLQAANARRVRIATRDDEPELLALCRAKFTEEGVATYDEDKVRGVIRRAFDPTRNDPAIIGVVGANGVEGSVYIRVEHPWYSYEPYLELVWSYVMPQFRNSTHAKDLLYFAKELASARHGGVGLALRVDTIVTPKTEAQVRLLKRQFGNPVAYSWACNGGIE